MQLVKITGERVYIRKLAPLTAYLGGLAAARAGVPIHANPYIAGWPEWHEWRDGHKAAS